MIPYPPWLNAGDNAWQLAAATLAATNAASPPVFCDTPITSGRSATTDYSDR
jgi:hypothetical protein